MKAWLLDILRCPQCGGTLSSRSPSSTIVTNGELACAQQHAFPIENGVPRFVSTDSYANNFGFQWNRFSRTQLDSHSGVPISRERFDVSTGWAAADLAGATVLDVGCGAGRFAEIALSYGARVVGVDYSSAAHACNANLGASDMLGVVRADVYHLPFAPERFDFVYCLGVLQHTPDVERAFRALPSQLRNGGRIAVDVYPLLWQNLAAARYWVRPVTTRMDQARLFDVVERAVPVLLPISRALGRVPGVGRKLRHLVPVSNYSGVFPLSETQLREWAVLDTFDMLAPAHDHPQSAETLRRWFEEARLVDIEIFRRGHLIGRGRKPERQDAAHRIAG